MTTPFAVIVRAALDEIDDLPGNDHWTVRDASKLAESIQVHLTAYALANVEDPEYVEPVRQDDWDEAMAPGTMGVALFGDREDRS